MNVSESAINTLRVIRDLAWQNGRTNEAFGIIERMAESLLRECGVNDGPAPNPRPYGWMVGT